jgi:hypothetical protein
MASKGKPGRPSTFSQEMADRICEALAGGTSLRQICLADDVPHMATVMRWLGDQQGFREQYARAREMQADAIFDEILHIADTPLIGTKTKESSDGKIETMTADMIEHRRLQVDARKWLAGKLQPKKYGDKISTEVSGPDGGPMQVATANISHRDRARALASLVARAKAEG